MADYRVAFWIIEYLTRLSVTFDPLSDSCFDQVSHIPCFVKIAKLSAMSLVLSKLHLLCRSDRVVRVLDERLRPSSHWLMLKQSTPGNPCISQFGFRPKKLLDGLVSNP